jgi:hypothetical protein
LHFGRLAASIKVTNPEGQQNCYLVVGANGEKMNEAVQNFVATPVELNAKAVQYDDWIVLYANKESIQHISRSAFFQSTGSVIACAGCK